MRGLYSKLRARFMPPIPGAIRDDFTLLRAKRVETQTSMMFLMLLATTPTAALAGGADVHWSVKFGFPAVLAILCVFGLIENWQGRKRRMTLRRATIIVAKASRVSGLVAVMCSVWCVINWLASPPENHSSFAMILTMGALATAYCLSSIRFAAILNLAIGVIPVSLLMFTAGGPAEIGAATSLLLATAILIRFILQGHTMLVELLEMQQQTRLLAHTDALTGLANRRALDEQIALLADPRLKTPPFKLALLDLDGFKPVNDRHGHVVGDKLLRSVAERLRDAIGDQGLVVRFGGDEFAVLVPPGSSLSDAPIADRILIELVRPHLIDGVPIAVSASVGVAQWPADGASADALVKHADRALYRAKAKAAAAMGSTVQRAKHPARHARHSE